jgi:hypothetical protein
MKHKHISLAMQLFDVGGSSPVLHKLLDSGELDVKGKRVVIPGCGRGYDVVTFAKAGRDWAG